MENDLGKFIGSAIDALIAAARESHAKMNERNSIIAAGLLSYDNDPHGALAFARAVVRGLVAPCQRQLQGCGGKGTNHDGTEVCSICRGFVAFPDGRTGVLTEPGIAFAAFLKRALVPTLTAAAQPEALAQARAEVARREEQAKQRDEERSSRSAEERKILLEAQAKLDALNGKHPDQAILDAQVTEHVKSTSQSRHPARGAR